MTLTEMAGSQGETQPCYRASTYSADVVEGRMPRPKRISDIDVLDAAHSELLRLGPTAFTLNSVSAVTGLARATLIQRFQSRDGLLRVLAERQVELTRDYLASLEVDRSISGLWRFLDQIVTSMGDGSNFIVHVEAAWTEAKDPHMRSCANQRYRLVQEAIAARVPVSLQNAAQIAPILHAVIAGASMQWLALQDSPLSSSVLGRLKETFCLLQLKP